MSVLLAQAFVSHNDIQQLCAKRQKLLRRADDFIRLAIAACDAAFSSLPAQPQTAVQQTALFVGTCFGPMQCNFEVIDDLAENNIASPSLFSHSVFNAAAGYISRIYQMEAGAWTLTSFGAPLFSCLHNALAFLAAGQCSRALVLQVETYSPLLADGLRHHTGDTNDTGAPWPAGASAFLLADRASHPPGVAIEHFSYVSTPCPATSFLRREDSLVINGQGRILGDPLAASREICTVLSSSSAPEIHLAYSSPWAECSFDIVAAEKS
jgi:hypothetical protein